MDASSFKMNLSAHGKNCSDVLCVLPVCVNWKLASSCNKATQKSKRNRLTSDTESPRNEKLQRSEICKEMEYLTQSSPSEDRDDETLKQLLEDLEDFEKDFEIGNGDFHCSLSGFADSQNDNPLANQSRHDDLHLFSSDSSISWNQLRNQQLPCAISNPLLNMQARETTAQPLSKKAELPSRENSTALVILPEKSKYGDLTDFPNLDMEQFISVDQYACSTSTRKCTTIRSPQSDDNSSMTNSLGSRAMEEIVCILKDNKEEPRKKKNRSVEQPNNTNRLFGVLSEILRLLELPVPKDLEAFYVQVLQKALVEIRCTVVYFENLRALRKKTGTPPQKASDC